MFEIGPISKMSTAPLLADIAAKGEVPWTIRRPSILPEGQRMPERGGRPLTLTDLATHRS
jgi:CubicO group peptidase (beta-lactamase class C family)